VVSYNSLSRSTKWCGFREDATPFLRNDEVGPCKWGMNLKSVNRDRLLIAILENVRLIFSLSINPRANLGAADNFSFSQKTLQRILCKSKVDFVRRNQWVLVYKKRKTALSPANYIILNIVPCVKPTKVLGRFLNTRYEKLVTLCERNNPSSLTAPGMNLRIVRMNFSNYTTLVYYKLQLT
jgi:hypothetical protein